MAAKKQTQKRSTRADAMKAEQAKFEADLASVGGKRSRLMQRHATVIQDAIATQRQLEDVGEMFTYHAPTDAQVEALKAVREAARNLAETIIVHSPRSADQSAGIRKLRECVMTVNASIVLEGRLS
jgi:predicted metal-dependent TIM-barrel fold hydrolase